MPPVKHSRPHCLALHTMLPPLHLYLLPPFASSSYALKYRLACGAVVLRVEGANYVGGGIEKGRRRTPAFESPGGEASYPCPGAAALPACSIPRHSHAATSPVAAAASPVAAATSPAFGCCSYCPRRSRRRSRRRSPLHDTTSPCCRRLSNHSLASSPTRDAFAPPILFTPRPVHLD